MKFKTKNIISLVLVISLMAAFVLPSAVFAAVPTATAVATTVENSEGTARTDKITVSFSEAVVFDATDWETNIKVDNSGSSGSFGTGATAVLDSTNNTDLVITLGTSSDIAVGSSIVVANDIIKDAATQLNYFNASIAVTGSFEPADINYNLDPSTATITVTGYTTPPAKLGIGTYDYSVEYTNYVTKTGSFEVKAADLGNTVDVDVTLDKKGANYTALTNAVTTASTYLAADYTAASFATLQTAVTNANNVADDLKFDEQSTIETLVTAIEDAIKGLIPCKTVSFIAVATATDATVNYGKANKINLVFAEPIAASANVIDRLSIKDKVESAAWVGSNNTIYELTLKADADLANDTEIIYTTDDSVKTLTGYVLNNTQTTVVGNLKPASEKVTATSMAATIVKISDKPGVVAGDKIVLVFNAPVLNNPASFKVTTAASKELTANVVANTSNTVYEITLEATSEVSNATKLTFGSITNVPLNGSFGSVVAPKALKAYAVDNDGTALVVGDEIVVVFDRPTNGVAITKEKLGAAGMLTGIAGASFGSNSEAVWEDDNTKLVITIGDTATIANGVKINLTNMGIKDKYDLIDASIATLTVEGSFGYTVQPRSTKAVAFTQNDLDYIRVFFNTEVKAKAGETIDVSISGFTMGASANCRLVDTGNGLTYYEVSMAKDEHSAFESGKYGISLSGVVDKETGKKELATTAVTITGAFVSPITPEVIKVVAISNDGSGVAKAGDKIIAVFNTEVTLGTVAAASGYLGTGYSVNYSTVSKNVIEIILGNAGLNVVPGTTEITFNDFKDLATESVTMAETKEKVGGSFGFNEVPVILSATAISNDGSGVPKAGDKIIVVFNTMVTVDGNDVYYYEYTLSDDNEYKIGDLFSKSVVSKATGLTYNLSKEVSGSFGYSELPVVKSVVLAEAAGAETITVLFDRATNKADINTSVLYDNNNHLGQGTTAVWSSNNILKISLAATANTTNSDKLNLSGLGIKAADTLADITAIDALAISGTLIPVVKTVVASGKTIVITFSARTNGVANITNYMTLFGTGSKAVWSDYNKKLTISLGENYSISNNGFVILNGMGICDKFSGEYKIIGQYKISGSIETDKLTVSKVVAQSNEKSSLAAQKGDTIVVKFNSATNLKGANLNEIASVDEIITVEGGNEAAFGTGYTGMWTAFDTFVITLGGKTVDNTVEPAVTTGNDPAITVGNNIKINGVAFANGEGIMDAAEIGLSGSFNGREFIVTDGFLTRIGANNTGDYRVAVKIENTLLSSNIIPTIVCVSYNGTTPVSVTRICVDVENSIQPVFELPESAKITSAKIYVFNDIFSDMTSSPEVLAETVEIK